MKLVGVHQQRRVWMGVLGETAVTLIAEVDEFYGDIYLGISPTRAVWQLARTPVGSSPLRARLLPSRLHVPASARVICVGLNYRAHAAEGSSRYPLHPAIFGRWTASLTVSGTPAPVNANEPGLDWEGRLRRSSARD